MGAVRTYRPLAHIRIRRTSGSTAVCKLPAGRQPSRAERRHGVLGQDTLDYYRGWLAYRRWFLRIPGVQVCVAQDGVPRLSAAFGTANEPAGTPLTERHLFRIASHSKTFTAVLVLRLVERGR